MGADHIPVWKPIRRGLTISILFILVPKRFGKRPLGQFTVFQLAVLRLAAHSLQPAMTRTDSSLLCGIILGGTLFIGNRSLSWTSLRFPPLKRLLQPPPSIVARDGRWDRRALPRDWIDLDEIETALHHAGLRDISHAALVVLEADDMISVIPKQSAIRKQEKTR